MTDRVLNAINWPPNSRNPTDVTAEASFTAWEDETVGSSWLVCFFFLGTLFSVGGDSGERGLDTAFFSLVAFLAAFFTALTLSFSRRLLSLLAFLSYKSNSFRRFLRALSIASSYFRTRSASTTASF